MVCISLRAVQRLKSSHSLIKFSPRLVDVELVDLSVETLLQAEDEVCRRVVAWRVTPLKWLVKGVTSHFITRAKLLRGLTNHALSKWDARPK